jgi:Fe-S cluster assembly ATP-binding protein
VAGRDDYDVSGSVTYDGLDLLDLDPEDRAAAGLFLGFQYPIELPGVNNLYFLRTALNSQRKARGEPEISARDFLTLSRDALDLVDLGEEFLHRSVNAGFSGGEKKRNEILQMAILQPRFALLDETDSGLDIDALRVVAEGVNALRAPDRAMLIITHYQRLLDHIEPDRVHVLAEGRIVASGDKSLAHRLEAEGYTGLLASAGARS